MPDDQSRLPSETGGAGDLDALAAAARSRFRTSEDIATEFIRDAVLHGIFRPGEHLNQDRIAEILGMSRIPIRASLRQLEAERLVTLHRFRGATVSSLAVQDVDEIYELRVEIECLALGHVAERLTPGTAQELLIRASELDEAAADPERWPAIHRDFYRSLFASAGRARLADLVDALRTEIGGYTTIHRVARAHAGHRRLIEMLVAGDVEAAQAWHRSHLLAVRDRLIASLEAEASAFAGARDAGAMDGGVQPSQAG